MELTREQALKLHRQMWADMQQELGDNPNSFERELYKQKWCREHFPDENIRDCCFLCEYAHNKYKSNGGFPCRYCLIKWDCNYCFEGDSIKKSYRNMPISQLLALPEREIDEVN